MYVTGWDGWPWALDAATGKELWRYRHAIPFDVSLCCGNVNRGVAVANGKVFIVTQNAHIMALDAADGKPVWDKAYGDVRAGESATVAPLIIKDLVIVGSSGGEFGVRGHIDAFNLDTGEHAWRCYTVPKPGEPGSDTWPADGEAWARGGANSDHRHLRPGLNLIYWGTGNPAPDFDGGVRQGANLFTDSWSLSIPTPARSATTTSTTRTTYGTTTASPSTSCSSWTAVRRWPTSTRTGTASSSIARPSADPGVPVRRPDHLG